MKDPEASVVEESEGIEESCDECQRNSTSNQYKKSVAFSSDGGCGVKKTSDSGVSQATRLRSRRNALCDPFKLPMPQQTREKLERDRDKRKTSVTRKVSNFLTVNLDLNREEDLL